MCQAYEAEYTSIVRGENRATIAGFKAAQNGEEKRRNPHSSKYDGYNYDAWNHGFDCFKERLLPWAIERQYTDYKEREELHVYFRQHGRLPDAVMRRVE